MDSKWADYQSLLGLSIGFNAAYYSISQFLSPDATVQAQLVLMAKDFADKALPGSEHADDLATLHSELLGQQQSDRKWLGGIGVASIFFFIISFVVLFYASVYANAHVNPIFIVPFCLLSTLPFIVGVLYMAIFSSATYRQLAAKRQGIEDRMTNAIQAIRAKIDAEIAKIPPAPSK